MTPEGGNEWEEDTLVGPGPDTVRMPASRPPEAPSGVWEVVPPTVGVLDGGILWAPKPDLPVPGGVRGPTLYQGAWR